MATVTLDAVRKVYDNRVVAVHGATFEVADGEFVVLVGPSGCGKSTTLRMIAGLESISSGRLLIEGEEVNQVPPKDRDVAMVFQNYALYPHMTTFDNMAFGLRLRSYSKKEIQLRVEEAAAILSIEEILDRKPRHLSGGQRQRVAVGRAIVRKPRVFLFDEPLSNLDAKLRVQMRTEIAKLHRRLDATMIYVTHDQVEAMTMGDRIVVMKDGHIQQIDTPLTLYNQPANRFTAGFIGSPAMNFIEGRIVRRDDLCFESTQQQLAFTLLPSMQAKLVGYTEQPITCGIRPEDIYVKSQAPSPATHTEILLPIEVIEPMGNETIMYAGLESHQVVARLAPQPFPAPGHSLPLLFDLDKVQFFDQDTGIRIE